MKLQTNHMLFGYAADCVGVFWKMRPRRSFFLSAAPFEESNSVGIRLFWSAA